MVQTWYRFGRLTSFLPCDGLTLLCHSERYHLENVSRHISMSTQGEVEGVGIIGLENEPKIILRPSGQLEVQFSCSTSGTCGDTLQCSLICLGCSTGQCKADLEFALVLDIKEPSTIQCKASVYSRPYSSFLHPHNITDYLAVQIRKHAL
jgi:hypothetical protein